MELLVLSSYPEKGEIHGKKTVGVANYTKATLLAVKKANPSLNITVIAENLGDDTNEYQDEEAKVIRIWKRENIASIYKAFSYLLNSKNKQIMLPFEMFMFGNFVHVVLVLPILLILRLTGKKTVLILHQVVGSGISAFEKNPIKAAFYSAVNKLFYSYLVFVSSKVVVFEQEFKIRLGNKDNVIVIPHAVIQEQKIDKLEAKRQLNLDENKKYVFYFGYLSPYKGVGELLDIWQSMTDVQLIIGGGGNPNHLEEPEYKQFVDNIMQKAHQKDALTTGFIPEDQMKLYFCAVDLVILPYTVFMSSSGPLAHAFSYGRAVMLSEPLKGYFNSQDMQQALTETGLTSQNLTFSLNEPITTKIGWAMQNIQKLENFSNKMCQIRSWYSIGEGYNEIFRSLG